MKYICVILINIFLCNNIFAQRPSTENFHRYYPADHPYNYLLIAPGTLGPNALPIPEILNGNVGTDLHFKFAVNNYYRKGGGDTGHMLHINFRVPVVQNFMAFEFKWDLVDYYHTENKVRDFMQVFKDDPGWTADVGDLIISTYIQLFREKKYIPATMFSSTFKTTSGSVEDARYTDLPAHWHFINLGKNLIQLNDFCWRLNGMAGIYIWQTNQADLEQNDGFLWGLENQLTYKKTDFAVSLSGYSGWKWYDYDKPVIFSGKITYNTERLNYFVECKTGLQDYFYSMLKIGVNLHFLSPFQLTRDLNKTQ